LSAQVAVIARFVILLRRTVAHTIIGVAGAALVALVRRLTDHWVLPGASAGLTRVGPRALIAVIAHRAVLLLWIRAATSGGIANAGVVTLI
jgi:hypothetical protein